RGSVRFSDDGEPWVAAYARVGALGWAVVVEQPEADAFAAAQHMRQQTLWWIWGTAVLALGTSVAFASSLRRALEKLVGGARAFGEGQLEHEIQVSSHDELGELARTMNSMAWALRHSLSDLQEWSHTLEQRVDERTRELKATQGQMLLQAELAAIGQLGAGVAHEVNNPLAALLGHVQLLLYARQPDDPDYESLKQIEEAANRCRTITLNLLRFSQRHELGPRPMRLNDVVREVASLMTPSIRAIGVTLSLQLDPDVPELVADAGQLSVVFTNLLTNARDATPAGGHMEIGTRPQGDGAAMWVTDSGRGIASEHLPRIFEPFFTTKEVWTGVGLGLSVAYRIVSDHGGRLTVTSEVGKGSTFTVLLPRHAAPRPVKTATKGALEAEAARAALRRPA
ncbi:MAG TPA: ATP-binding protein, partial [Myxococcota bacterium]|nr:ATP-binding protein [Myxococcota bacterium]